MKLNRLRKKDQNKATLVLKQMSDTVMMQSGIPVDVHQSTSRNLGLMNEYLKLKIARGSQLVYDDPAHKTIEEKDFSKQQVEGKDASKEQVETIDKSNQEVKATKEDIKFNFDTLKKDWFN